MLKNNGLECTYMTQGAVIPYCKGCGHTIVTKKLNEALEKLNYPPSDVVLVTDIGCIGLIDALFDKVHTVHTTHGRSTAFATGIAVADKTIGKKKLKTIVMIGDGGSMIGLLHIVNTALLNTDVTVLIADNFLFGMTGGQQSSFSPIDFITQTTPQGNIVPPLDICSVAISAKAEFVARKIASDKDLTDVFAAAISHDGFSIVEVLELCTEHATTKNELKGSELINIAEVHGHTLGIIKSDDSRIEFGKNYVGKYHSEQKSVKPKDSGIEIEAKNNLTKPISFFISGSAGEKVQSAAAMLCESAVRCGLFSSQKNDNPVTQGSGFSLSEVIISPEEILYTGAENPSVVVLASEEGLKEAIAQKVFDRVTVESIIIADESLTLPECKGEVVKLSLRKSCGAYKAALGAIDYFVTHKNPFPVEVLHKLIEKKFGSYESFYKEKFI